MNRPVSENDIDHINFSPYPAVTYISCHGRSQTDEIKEELSGDQPIEKYNNDSSGILTSLFRAHTIPELVHWHNTWQIPAWHKSRQCH